MKKLFSAAPGTICNTEAFPRFTFCALELFEQLRMAVDLSQFVTTIKTQQVKLSTVRLFLIVVRLRYTWTSYLNFFTRVLYIKVFLDRLSLKKRKKEEEEDKQVIKTSWSFLTKISLSSASSKILQSLLQYLSQI